MSVLFLIPQIQDGRHIILLSDLLKKRKYAITISLLELKCIFQPNPWSLELI